MSTAIGSLFFLTIFYKFIFFFFADMTKTMTQLYVCLAVLLSTSCKSSNFYLSLFNINACCSLQFSSSRTLFFFFFSTKTKKNLFFKLCKNSPLPLHFSFSKLYLFFVKVTNFNSLSTRFCPCI